MGLYKLSLKIGGLVSVIIDCKYFTNAHSEKDIDLAMYGCTDVRIYVQSIITLQVL